MKNRNDKKQVKEEIQEIESSGTFEFPNNSYYIGAYKKLSNGSLVRKGFGKLIHRGINNSDIGEEYYEGNWDNDKFNGQGKYQYSNGDLYIGEFKDNLHHGNGILKCADGTSYEGQFQNHKFHGSGTFFDMDGIAWRGEFREGFYSSKEQPKLKEEKRVKTKLEAWQKFAFDFFKQWEETLAKSDKKTIKEQVSYYFANSENMGGYIKDPYVKPDEKTPDKWNEVFKFVFNQSNNIRINIIRDEPDDVLFFDIHRILCNQFNEELSHGQIIEIVTNLNERTVYLAIAYNSATSKWMVVHFKDETIKVKK